MPTTAKAATQLCISALSDTTTAPLSSDSPKSRARINATNDIATPLCVGYLCSSLQ